MKEIGKAFLVLITLVLVSTLVYAAEIHWAIIDGDLDKVEAILAKDPMQIEANDFNYAYGDSESVYNFSLLTPLHVAVMEDRKDIVAFLLAKGAPVNELQQQNNFTPLHFAALKNRLEVAELLLSKGAFINAKANWLGETSVTPLHLALLSRAKKMVILLLGKGADINAKLGNGDTPLHLAVASGDKDLVLILLDKDADSGLLNDKGLSAVEVAAVNSNEAMLKIFAAKGIIPDPKRVSMLKGKTLQDEAKTNLGVIFVCELSYFGEYNTYGHSFGLIGWKPEIKNRYAYFLGNDAIQAKEGGPYRMPKGVKSIVSNSAFTAVAVGNIDGDPTLDVWTINDQKELVNVVNDVEK